jgi:Protein of unknown function (DUF3889)
MMYYNYSSSNQPGYNPYPVYGYSPVSQGYFVNMAMDFRQQVIKGQATWTEGGQVTKCGIPWTRNQYLTVAVGEGTSYQCGQSLKIRNPANAREVIVTVVDQVPGYPQNRVNLHRRAFQALGGNLSQGILNIEIMPSPELEEEKWGKYLLELVQTAYPGSRVTDYSSVGKNQMSPTRVRETFDFILSTQQEQIKIRGNVIYDPQTDRVISFDLAEI